MGKPKILSFIKGMKKEHKVYRTWGNGGCLCNRFNRYYRAEQRRPNDDHLGGFFGKGH